MTTTRNYLSAHAVARRLDIDFRTLKRLVKSDIVRPCFRAGDRLLIREDRLGDLKVLVGAHMRRN